MVWHLLLLIGRRWLSECGVLFQECLEAAAVEKESALIQAEKNKELASDIRLQYDNLVSVLCLWKCDNEREFLVL